jgi:hypothetical protein|tara:strand:- start:756 stop:1214 length:459 start_codon:yes stop_codon:yes gene_type:complete
MGDSVKKHFELVSEAEFDATAATAMATSAAKKIEKENIIAGLGVIEVFETSYPELSKEFKQIQGEMYEMFARKHMDYGLNNIALGGDLKDEADKKFSLTGLCIRLTDKISRLKNLLSNGKNYVKGEGMEDTFIDIANYGIIGLLVGRDKWKK